MTATRTFSLKEMLGEGVVISMTPSLVSAGLVQKEDMESTQATFTEISGHRKEPHMLALQLAGVREADMQIVRQSSSIMYES